jgi:hypothetical protein
MSSEILAAERFMMMLLVVRGESDVTKIVVNGTILIWGLPNGDKREIRGFSNSTLKTSYYHRHNSTSISGSVKAMGPLLFSIRRVQPRLYVGFCAFSSKHSKNGPGPNSSERRWCQWVYLNNAPCALSIPTEAKFIRRYRQSCRLDKVLINMRPMQRPRIERVPSASIVADVP